MESTSAPAVRHHSVAKRLISFFVVAAIVVSAVGLQSSPANADVANDFGVDGDPIWQTVGGEDPTAARGTVDAIAELNGVVYVGGWFTGVRSNYFSSETIAQPYLAAFDATTGVHVPGFAPVLDAHVRDIVPSADGTRLFVGGGFTSVNGDATAKGIVSLDPTTGVVQTDWRATLTYEWGAGDAEVRAIQLFGNHVYIGGNFSHAVSHQPTTRTRVNKLARLDKDDGRADPAWTPKASIGQVNDLEISTDGSRAYVVGSFRSMNDDTSAEGFAVVDLTTGALVPGVKHGGFFAYEEYISVEAEATHVYITGKLNRLEKRNVTDLEVDAFFRGDGDGQEILLTDNYIYWGGHFEEYIFEGPTTALPIDPYFLVRVDRATFSLDLDFNPVNNGNNGVWEIHAAADGRLWYGGDLTYIGARRLSGFGRLSVEDTSPPTVPLNLLASEVLDYSVVLSWDASTDDRNIRQYVIYRDGVEFIRTKSLAYTDLTVAPDTTYTYEVEAVDEQSNLSGLSSALTVTTQAVINSSEFLAAGSVWSYLDDGTDQGSAWTAPSFDDTTWSTGNAQFGYGDSDESTVVDWGTNQWQRHITTYFRTQFELADATQWSTLDLGLLRDDGAVVYLNGVEILRDNMPAGVIDHTTTASSAVYGSNEATYNPFVLAASVLTSGTNTIAVELHKSISSNPDASFDLTLTGASGGSADTEAPTAPTAITAPSITDTTVDLDWNAATDNVGVSNYRVYRNSVLVGGATSTGFVDTNLTATTTYTYEITALDAAGNESPLSIALPVTTDLPPFQADLIDTGSAWTYLDDGSDQGTAWTASTFDDAGWSEGNARLGYGGDGETTVIDWGTNQWQRHITTYFRTQFDVDDAMRVDQLMVNLLRDDGAVVYLNDVEVLRDNMPTGTIDAATLASSGVWGSAENTYYQFSVPATSLVTGTNTLAVELHKYSTASPDAGFDLELDVTELN